MTRTFISLEFNQDQLRHLEDVIQQVAPLLPSIRFVAPASIHLTLAFLGELDALQLAQAIVATEQAAHLSPPFSYRLDHLGIFGSPRSPRVFWMGIEEPTGSLLRLHRILNQQLEQRGFSTEKRPFSPHLTLARVKHPLPPLEQQQLHDLLASAPITSLLSVAHSLAVMKSELRPTGAHYTCLCTFHLTAL